MGLYYNVIGSDSLTTELIKPDSAFVASSVTIANVHDTVNATVSLFIQNDPVSGATNTYNIIHKVSVPPGSTLLIDDESIFSYSSGYGLYVEVTSSDTIDVIINK